MNLITGIYLSTAGLYASWVSPSVPSPRMLAGIARYQNLRVLPAQTVFENALLGKGYGKEGVGMAYSAPFSRYKRNEYIIEEIDEILEFVAF